MTKHYIKALTGAMIKEITLITGTWGETMQYRDRDGDGDGA